MIADLRRAGRPVPTNDIWIAATWHRAVENAESGTFCANFRLIPRIGSVIFDSPIGTAISPPPAM